MGRRSRTPKVPRPRGRGSRLTVAEIERNNKLQEGKLKRRLAALNLLPVASDDDKTALSTVNVKLEATSEESDDVKPNVDDINIETPEGEIGRCLICFTLHSSGGLTQKPPRFPGAACLSSGASKCVNKQLWSMFILRNLLQFPQEECEKVFLMTSGVSNPETWYSICHSCSRIAAEAVKAYQEMLRLRESIRKKLFESLKSEKSCKVDDSGYYNISNEIRQYFRSTIPKTYHREDPQDFLETQEHVNAEMDDNDDRLNDFTGNHFLCISEEIASGPFQSTNQSTQVMPRQKGANTNQRPRRKQLASTRKTQLTESQATRKAGIGILRKAKLYNAEREKFVRMHRSKEKVDEFIERAYQHPTKKFQCKICNQLFTYIHTVSGHIRRVHREEIGLPPLDIKYQCDKCHFRTESNEDYQIHYRKHKKEELIDRTEPSGKLKCKVCGKTYDTQAKIHYHFVNCHRSELGMKSDILMCHLCGRECTSQYKLSLHIDYVHNKNRRYRCEHCGKGYVSKMEYTEHVALHLNNNIGPIICNICGLNFKRRIGLRQHMKRFHTKTNAVETVSPSPSSSNQAPENLPLVPVEADSVSVPSQTSTFEKECKYCKVKLLNRRMFNVHLKTAHSELYTHKCDLCEASYMTGHNLKIHKESAHSTKKAKCQYCDAEFTSYISIYEHVRKYCKKYDGGKVKVFPASEEAIAEPEKEAVPTNDFNFDQFL